MRFLTICLAISLTAIPGAWGVKKFQTATKPPPPPPAPPLVVFENSGQSERPRQARFEYFELIAPSQNQPNYNPSSLSISNPDFTVVYRPRPQPQQPQRPQVSQPQRPQQQFQRPQQQFQKPQRPIPPPLYQFPQQQRPQRPNSQFVSRPPSQPSTTGNRRPPPPPPRNQPFPDQRFTYLTYNQLQQPI